MAQPTTTRSILLRGGLDLVTPAIAIDPGQCIACEGYEADVAGYSRVAGYERHDGRPSPSEATYSVVFFDAGSAAFVTGDTITGGTSGATGVVLDDPVVQSGSYAGSNAAGYVPVRNVTGTFVDNEALQVSAVTRATLDGTVIARNALTDEQDAEWLALSQTARRSVITQVPGSGPVRGLWTHDGTLYAVRDNAGATAGVIHKETTSGWTAASLGSVLEFNTSTSGPFKEGEIVTGGSSAATGTIARVALLKNTWGASGEGYLVLTGIVGTFTSGETITGATAGSAKAGATTANTLPAGGTYKAVVNNFYADAGKTRVYVVNGVGRGFEFGGTYIAPIRTGVDVAKDKPTHVAVHQNHLFVGYSGGSLQHSEVGEPLQWTTTGGAGEIGFGDEFADLVPDVATALIIIGKRKISYLTGTSGQDFRIDPISDSAGGRSGTSQSIGGVVYLDQQGLRKISATQAFGNFRAGTLTEMVEPLLRAKNAAGVTPVASVRVRSRDIYRLFWSDKTVLSVYMGRKAPEVMAFTLPFQLSCVYAGERTDGREAIFAGSDDGWVYAIDKGDTFDGVAFDTMLQLPFNSLGSPTLNKAFKKVTVDLVGSSSTPLAIAADYAYGNPDFVASREQSFDVSGGGALWNIGVWNDFNWSSKAVGQAEAYIDGFGSNIAVAIRSDDSTPHTLSTLTLHYNLRGLVR